MKTEQAEQKRFIERYILDSIDGSGYNRDLTCDEEAIVFLIDTFKAEYGWCIDRKGQFEALVDWLMGLPSCINIAFNYCDIITLAKEQGTLPEDATGKQEDAICEKYWRYMAMRIQELWNRLSK